MLGEVQKLVSGSQVLTEGLSGVYAALNGNEVDPGGLPAPNPLHTGFDNFVSREGLAGDVNLDGVVDVTDLGILATNYGQNAKWSKGDLNMDGIVDVSDLGILATNYGTSVPDISQSPEPTTIALLALGGAGLLKRRRS